MNSAMLDAIRQAVYAARRRRDGLPIVADLHSRASRRSLDRVRAA